MNARQLAHFRKMLEEMKRELSQDIDRTVHTMQDEATIFADPNDRASQESDMSLELRNRDRERKLIKKIDETIGRIDAGRIRLLRLVRRRDRPEAPRSASDGDAVHRLQDAGRAAGAAGREVVGESGRAQPAPRLVSTNRKGQPRLPLSLCSAARPLLLHRLRLLLAAAAAAAALPAPPPSCERRSRPLSSASSTFTRTCWPSLRWSATAFTRSFAICEMCSRPSRPGSTLTIAPKSSSLSTVPS